MHWFCLKESCINCKNGIGFTYHAFFCPVCGNPRSLASIGATKTGAVSKENASLSSLFWDARQSEALKVSDFGHTIVYRTPIEHLLRTNGTTKKKGPLSIPPPPFIMSFRILQMVFQRCMSAGNHKTQI